MALLTKETKEMSLEDKLERNELSSRIENIGALLLRYGLVLVLGWIGAMKFTVYEAEGIKPLIETSPLMSWMLGSCRCKPPLT